MLRGAGEPEAEAHGDALLEADGGLPELTDLHEQVVLVEELVLGELVVARHQRLPAALHVAARAEGPPAGPLQQDRLHGRVRLPRGELLPDSLHHAQVGRVERLRSVEREHRQPIVALLAQDLLQRKDKNGLLVLERNCSTPFLLEPERKDLHDEISRSRFHPLRAPLWIIEHVRNSR